MDVIICLVLLNKKSISDIANVELLNHQTKQYFTQKVVKINGR